MKWLCLAFIMCFICGFAQAGFCEEAQRITKEQLKGMLGSPDLVIIDVRSAHDWEEGKRKIKGAIREDVFKIGSWIGKYPKDKTIVLYCQ